LICGTPEQHKPRIKRRTDALRTIPRVSIEFLLTSLVIVAIPGTGVLITLSAAITRGVRAGVVAAFGCTLGIVPHLIAAVTGTAALLRTSGVAFDALRLAGVAYLLFMAVVTWRDQSQLVVDADQPARSATRVIGSAMLSNLLNPKLTVFFFAFLPQFVPAHAPDAVARLLLLSGVFMAMTFAVFVIYAIAASAARRQIIERPPVLRRLRRAFSVSFVALGVKLATTSR
jgi:threonine/homoserine/homoserine lactone efflux protein